MNFLYDTLHTFVSKGVETAFLWDFSPYAHTVVLFGFLGLSRIVNNIKRLNLTRYLNNDICSYGFQVIHSYLYNYRIEPRELSWLNLSYITLIYPNLNTTKYNYSETYEHNTFNNETTSLHFNTMILKESTKNFIEDDNKTHLLTMKTNNQYLYRIQSMSKRCVTPHYNIDHVKSCFLSILYTHPIMEHPIYIEIPKNACLVGNEILSSIFVLRYLEYQSMPFVFDLKYTLQIIDNHVNQFILKCHQYILLEPDNKYKVLSLYP